MITIPFYLAIVMQNPSLLISYVTSRCLGENEALGGANGQWKG